VSMDISFSFLCFPRASPSPAAPAPGVAATPVAMRLDQFDGGSRCSWAVVAGFPRHELHDVAVGDGEGLGPVEGGGGQ